MGFSYGMGLNQGFGMFHLFDTLLLRDDIDRLDISLFGKLFRYPFCLYLIHLHIHYGRESYILLEEIGNTLGVGSHDAGNTYQKQYQAYTYHRRQV